MLNYLLITIVNYFVFNAILGTYLTIKAGYQYPSNTLYDLAQGWLILLFVGLPVLVVAGIESEF